MWTVIDFGKWCGKGLTLPRPLASGSGSRTRRIGKSNTSLAQMAHSHASMSFLKADYPTWVPANPLDRDISAWIFRARWYDKVGYHLMLMNFKYHWFGRADARLTRRQREKFFADAANFE